MRRRKRRGHGGAFSSSEDINPMDYLGNMSDAMLVLAVGMMLALVIAWEVPISGSDSTDAGSTSGMTQVDMQDAEALDPDTDRLDTSTTPTDGSVPIEEYGLKEYGTVYTDSEGNMYVITDGGN